MVNLETREIQIGATVFPIKAFEVWWRIPVGLTSSIDIAIAKCKELDLDPNLCIKPTVVAVSADSIYEEVVH